MPLCRCISRKRTRNNRVWWINDEGVEIDERQYTGLRRHIEDDTTENDIAVSLAGWLAEFKWHGRGSLKEDSDLLWLIEDVRLDDELSEDRDGDDFSAFDRLLRDNPYATDAEILLSYRMHQRRVIELLDDPIIWRAVESVAALLIEHGKIGDDAVQAIFKETMAFETDHGRRAITEDC